MPVMSEKAANKAGMQYIIILSKYSPPYEQF